MALPADTVEGLRDWYQFRDFQHFVEVYVAVSRCIRTPEDIELVFREFLLGQSEQNVLHTEATYTACTIQKFAGIPWNEQSSAICSARDWAAAELGVSLGLILDIVRGDSVDRAYEILEWATSGPEVGVVALGLAGMEWLGTKEYREVFDEAQRRGLSIVVHAGETTGPETIWDALEHCHADRIGHGVRCLEDPVLTQHLLDHQTHLEVNPSSNVCLGVFPSFGVHPLGRMVSEGLNVSLNSDDPPMFSTTLTGEWLKSVETFGWDRETVHRLHRNAVEAALVDDVRREELRRLVLSDVASA